MRTAPHVAAVLLSFIVSGCGPSAPEDEYAQLQQLLKASEERLGAIGKTERKSYPIGSAWSLNLEGATVDQQVIQDIISLDRVSELSLSGSTITDEQLQVVLQASNTGYLNVLDVSNTAITDAGLAGLAGKRYLQKLNIQGAQVSDAFTSSLDSERSSNAEVGDGFKKVEVTK